MLMASAKDTETGIPQKLLDDKEAEEKQRRELREGINVSLCLVLCPLLPFSVGFFRPHQLSCQQSIVCIVSSAKHVEALGMDLNPWIQVQETQNLPQQSPSKS